MIKMMKKVELKLGQMTHQTERKSANESSHKTQKESLRHTNEQGIAGQRLEHVTHKGQDGQENGRGHKGEERGKGNEGAAEASKGGNSRGWNGDGNSGIFWEEGTEKDETDTDEEATSDLRGNDEEE